ncbi:MAG: bifunctional diguanylate cyclase/phosphodiesterase [Pseudomonadales bacterium]
MFISFISSSKHRRQLYAALMFVILSFGVEYWIEGLIEQRHVQAASVETLQELGVVRARLESILNHNLSLITGMSIAIAANPTLDEEDFAQYAEQVLRNETLLVNFAAAPDMVVSYVYPLEGNEAVIGLDYMANEAQRAGVLAVKKARTQQIIGPVNLVQGGRAFIGRAPVFFYDHILEQERFWGILSAPMMIEKVLNAAGFFQMEERQGRAVGLRKKHLDGDYTMLQGPTGVFLSKPLIVELLIANESWELGIQRDFQPEGMSEVIFYVRTAFGAFLLLILSIILIRVRQSYERGLLIAELKYRESMLARVGSIASVGGWEYYPQEGFKFWSDEIYSLLGLDNYGQFLTLHQLETFVEPDQLEYLHLSLRRFANSGEALDIELSIEALDGQHKWVQIQAQRNTRDGQQVVQGVIQDVTERKKSAEIIRQQANYDPLTHLINRSQFDEKLAETIKTSRRMSADFALLYIDLDGFKLINDSLGHYVGDQLLIQVALRLSESTRKSDVLSRRSGDEFTLIINHLREQGDLIPLIKSLLHKLKQPFTIANHQVCISASIGVSVYPQDGLDGATLLKNADQGMYRAKGMGRNTYCYFTKQMQIETDRRLTLHTDMVYALDNDLMDVNYQPIIDVTSGEVAECEALIRWNHPQLGIISPQELVELAENVGQIKKLGDFVMRRAVADLREVNRELGADIALALNKSYREFLTTDAAEPAWIDALIGERADLRVTIEITESLLIDNDEIYDLLQKLRRAGINIAIDDFGTGYSSLSYLRQFPVDYLKIDRSFIKDIDSSEEELALVEIILAMAKNLGVKVVAEGVENAVQLSLLQVRECEYCQGYHIARPKTKEGLLQWLHARQRVLSE